MRKALEKRTMSAETMKFRSFNGNKTDQYLDTLESIKNKNDETYHNI